MNTKGEVLIQVQNLQKSFDGHVVLDGISTEIHKGEVVAVIGALLVPVNLHFCVL